MSNVAVKHDLYDVIRTPVITEKSTVGSEQNRYTFKVAVSATKEDIRKAVKLAFGVDALSINTIKVKGKTKRFRGLPGKRPDYKKAIIKLADGQSIDVTTEI
jgi:large subunit ribosomal protein L23